MEREAGGVPLLEPGALGIGQLFGVVGDAVIVGEASAGRIVLWNPAAERIFGYPAEEAVGMPIEELVPPALRGRHRDGLRRFATSGETVLVGSGRAVELPAIRRDGTELWVELTLSPIEADGVPGRFVLGIVRDVTERRQAQAQLAAAADQLGAANRALKEFLVMAAHDLRTPLTTIMVTAGLLSSRKLSADEVVELSELIARQAENLSALISDLAELGHIELGETKTNPVSVRVGEVIAEAREAAGVVLPPSSVHVPEDLTLWADRVHVRRILVNYLANARNHAGTGISLMARAADGWVEVCVADIGPGVPPEFVPRLFEKFSRGAASAGKPGRGLGLAIVAGLAQLNGGAAWYEPNQPTGARFWVRLPA